MPKPSPQPHESIRKKCHQVLEQLLKDVETEQEPPGTAGARPTIGTTTTGKSDDTTLSLSSSKTTTTVQNLQMIGDCFQSVLQKRLEEEKRLGSPLLRLPTTILGMIVQFLDEEGLMALEISNKESWNTNESGIVLTQWKTLDKMRKHQPGYLNVCPLSLAHLNKIMKDSAQCARFRGIHFAQAAAFARKMEASAKLHYGDGDSGSNPSKPPPSKKAKMDYEFPDELYNRRDFWKDFSDTVGNHNHRAEVSIFIRISIPSDEAGTPNTLFQSFQPRRCHDDMFGGNCSQDHFSVGEMIGDIIAPAICLCFTDTMSFGKDVMGVVTDKETGKSTWPATAIKSLMKKMSLTVVACTCDQNNPEKMIPKLVLATHGCHYCEATLGTHGDDDVNSITTRRGYKNKVEFLAEELGVGYLSDRTVETNKKIIEGSDENVWSDEFIQTSICRTKDGRSTKSDSESDGWCLHLFWSRIGDWIHYEW